MKSWREIRSKRDVRLEAADALAAQVRNFVNERENPAPDLTMRRIEYDHMVKLLERYEGLVKNA